MPIGIEGWIPLYRDIDSTELLINEDDTSPQSINVITPISVSLPPPPPKNSVPRPKPAMNPEE